MSYKHLNLEERHYIEIEYKKGASQSDIATDFGTPIEKLLFSFQGKLPSTFSRN